MNDDVKLNCYVGNNNDYNTFEQKNISNFDYGINTEPPPGEGRVFSCSGDYFYDGFKTFLFYFRKLVFCLDQEIWAPS